MADEKTFQCTVITPERQVLDCRAAFAAIPAHDGEIGIMSHRAPLMCELGIGVMRVESEGVTRRFFVDGGFAQVVHNRLAILTEQAVPSDEVDVDEAKQALQDAKAMTGTTSEALDERRKAIARASARIKAAGS
ncbi:MAG: ATP synthase F1 subunit epsilon [Planctomycetes bacterium]|nr:ATP synthase F1 subunit epsilon [Planctomycetota bacterium]